MDTVPVFVESVGVIFSILLLVLVPGFALSLVIFPRSSDLSASDRLVYSTVLSISASIASLVFMDIVLRLAITRENLILVVGVFSGILFIVWACERWYLNSRVPQHFGPQPPADDQHLQRFDSRKMNAEKDRFRQDTRTRVVYHESAPSGANHIDHSYLLDAGEEIAIQQVSENKLRVTDSFILDRPYPGTRYFELVIREFSGDGVSQVDDLQIYPVHVAKDPERKYPVTALQRDTLHITERIYRKDATNEVQWIYSHDFHIFAIIHEEDTADQMVDRILIKLDEIVASTKTGIPLSSHAEDRQILKEAFDRVIEKPRGPALPHRVQIPRHSPSGHDVPSMPMPHYGVAPPPVLRDAIPREEKDRIRAEPEESAELSEEPAVAEPAESPRHAVFQPRVLSRPVPKRPGSPAAGEPHGTTKSSEIVPTALPADTGERPVSLTSAGPAEVPSRPHVPADPRPEKILTRPGGRTPPSKKDLTHPENKLVVDSIRKLQKDILRDLDMFGLTPETFKKSEKHIENIHIPKKADVTKKLASAQEEITDLDWLYD